MDTWTQIQNLQIHYTGNNYILWIHIVLTTEDSWRLEYHRRICFSVLFYTEKNNAFFFLKKKHQSYYPPNLQTNNKSFLLACEPSRQLVCSTEYIVISTSAKGVVENFEVVEN